MAIAFGGISSVSTSQTPTSVSVSGANTVGFVYVVGDTTADNVTAVTWNGVSMTKIAAIQTPGGDRYSSVWWVANPASSTTISFTGGSFWRSYSFYYTGAAQASQVDSSNTGSNSANTAISVATTVAAIECWYVMCLKDGVGGATYTGSGVLVEERANADAGGIAIADSGTTVSTGSQSGTMTSASSTTHGAIAFSIRPYVADETYSLDLESGSSQAGTAQDSASLDTISSDLTFEALLKFESLPSSGNAFTLASRDPDDNANRAWEIRLHNNAGAYEIRAYNSSGGTNATTSSTVVVSIATPSTDTWYHYGISIDSGTLQVYIDGVDEGSASGMEATIYASGTSVLRIGASAQGTPARYFDGKIALARLWSVVRNQSELNTNKCTVLGSTANLIGEWTFNNTNVDNSGNSNTVTFSNAPIFAVDYPAFCTVVDVFQPRPLAIGNPMMY